MNDFLSVMGGYLDNPVVRATLATYTRGSLFNWPTPRELSQLADWVYNNQRIGRKAQPLPEDVRAAAAGDLKRMPQENIQKLLSSEDVNIPEGAAGRFRYAINAIFVQIGWDVLFRSLTKFLATQFSRRWTHHTFLDFNYDLLLEHEVRNVSGQQFDLPWDPLCGYGFETEEAGDNFRVFDSDVQREALTLRMEPDIEILKPHGSLNWVLPFTGNYLFQDRVPTIYLQGGQLAYSNEYDIGFQQALFIIAPTAQKYSAFKFVKRIIEREQQAINEAAEIYVIGWSMPASDTNQINLIHDAVRRNNPAQVTVVNYGANVDYFLRVAKLFAVEPKEIRGFNAGFVDFSDNPAAHDHGRSNRRVLMAR
jgi:hypothetical protein